MPIPLQAPYATTKHAAVGLPTSLRTEGAGLGVKVSVFCPGVIQTPLLEKSLVVKSSMNEILKMSRHTKPDKAQELLLSRLKLKLPPQPPPEISTGNLRSVVKTF